MASCKKTIHFPNGDSFFGYVDIDASQGTDVPYRGVYVAQNGQKYVGTMLSLMRHGQGKCMFTNGDVYEGTWIHGHLVGQGVFRVFATSSTFSGTFGHRVKPGQRSEFIGELDDSPKFEGLRTAKGFHPVSIQTTDASYQDGQEHLLTGVGKIHFADGLIFEGAWERGRPVTNGGTLFIPTRDDASGQAFDAYSGELSSLAWPSGVGQLDCADGNEYVGQFAAGHPHGQVVARYHDGGTYEGNMVAGGREGHGRLSFFNGDVYEGHFVDGRCEGRGRHTFVDGSVFDGFFQSDTRQCADVATARPAACVSMLYLKPFRLRILAQYARRLNHRPSSLTLDAPVNVLRPCSGRGRMLSPHGRSVFDGFWHHGKRHGHGVSYVPGTGERQEAIYECDKLAAPPRIFFQMRRLPRAIEKHTTGATLRSFLKPEDRPVRLDLRAMPAWVLSKRQNPAPEGHSLLHVQLQTRAGGAVTMNISFRPAPCTLARMHLSVASVITDAPSRELPLDTPGCSPWVRVHLFALGKGMLNENDRARWGIGAMVAVPPLLEWSTKDWANVADRSAEAVRRNAEGGGSLACTSSGRGPSSRVPLHEASELPDDFDDSTSDCDDCGSGDGGPGVPVLADDEPCDDVVRLNEQLTQLEQHIDQEAGYIEALTVKSAAWM